MAAVLTVVQVQVQDVQHYFQQSNPSGLNQVGIQNLYYRWMKLARLYDFEIAFLSQFENKSLRHKDPPSIVSNILTNFLCE